MAGKNRNIIIAFAENKDQADLFLRFQQAAYRHTFSIIYITVRYSIYKYIKTHCQFKNQVLFLNKSLIDHTVVVPDLSDDMDIKSGEITMREGEILYRTIWGGYSTINGNVKYILFTNGCWIRDHAFRDIADKYGIKTLCFELSNIPGKLFVDNKGSNAKSSLYSKHALLDQFEVLEGAYQEWKKRYIQIKLGEITIAQAKRERFYKAGEQYLIDMFGNWRYGGVKPRKISKNRLRTRIKSIFSSKENVLERMDLKEPYIFFPLQVSSDSQIILHARIGLEEALYQVIEMARQENKWLVIKPHPVEPYPKYLKEVLSKAQYDKILITKANTFQLIMHSDKVFTINSTVGLETLILEKPLIVIGKALYEHFSSSDIPKYVLGYLIDVDYWGREPLSDFQFEQILKRSELR